MPADQNQSLDFFVYIVESPSAPDLYHGRSEGSLVAQAVALDNIPCVTRTAIDRAAFTAALRIGLPEAMKGHPELVPILHISAHGGTDGLQLSNGDVIGWHDLRELVQPINASLDGILILCMSACKGYSACQMAMDEGDEPHPYLALIGNYGEPTWSDTAVGYSAFYHLITKGLLFREAVDGMKAASGDMRWTLETAAESKQSYLEFIRTVDPGQAQQQLERVAEQEQLPADAKAFEAGSVANPALNPTVGRGRPPAG